MSAHTCHAIGCERRVPPRLFMCAPHWRMVPKELQDAVWANYTRGQERDVSKVTPGYLDATREARRVVREMESGAFTQGPEEK